MSKPFLTAAWKKLLLVNYSVDPEILKPYLPAGVEPDSFDGIHYLSLVGFMFNDTKVLGVKVPFHVSFPEVNLRCYVKYNDDGQWKRGVVFLSEIVPKYAVAFIANKIYKENYRRMPMRVIYGENQHQLQAGYEWKFRNKWNKIEVIAAQTPESLVTGSCEEFITEHFWGYAKYGAAQTCEYQVAHPRWNTYPVQHFNIDCDFKALYGDAFGALSQQAPVSVYYADGSDIQVFPKRLI